MTRRMRCGCWAGLVAVGLAGGCGSLLPKRGQQPPQHASAALLDSGPTARVTGKQAADVQFAMGRTDEEQGQLDQAESAYRAALLKSPKRGDVEGRLAIVLDRKGKLVEADEHFARAIKLEPKDVDLRCDRGYSYYLRGQGAEAERSLRAALALDSGHARSHTNLGLVLAARGDADGALAEFGRAGTDPADSRANLALALALGGQVADARDQYARALKAKPTSAAAAEGLRVASSVLKASSAGPAGLPTLPGEPAPALAGGSKPRVDPAVMATSMGR